MFKKVVVTIFFITLVGISYVVIKDKMTVGELVDPIEYFDEFKNNKNNLVYRDERINLVEPVLEKDGVLYASYFFANEYVSDTIFYDEKEEILTLTNVREVVRLYKDNDNNITFSGVEGSYPLYENENGLYVPVSMLEDFFKVVIEKGKDERLYIARDKRLENKTGEVNKKTSLRTHPRDKSIVLEEIEKHSIVTIYSHEGDFARVRSDNGIIGYVPVKNLMSETNIPAESALNVQEWEINPLGEKVRLGWDQITTKSAGDWSSYKYDHTNSLNVISPTWFEFADSNGQLIDRATKEYVDIAHERNLQVWPIMSHNFTKPELTSEILTSTTKREYVINQLIDKSKEYGFDGINIDIENVQSAESPEWVQFMRELYPKLKAEGLVVSVDIYMPSSWSQYYERGKISEVVDYFMVMAYDQHWSGSENPGSVAEIDWTRNGVLKTLEEVPNEKLVMGMPFYTRLWVENSEGLSSTPYGMTSAQNLVNDWGVQVIKDEKSGQNYAKLEKEGEVHHIWLEDKESVAKRVEIMQENDLAGYGVWKLGLESNDIWEVLDEAN